MKLSLVLFLDLIKKTLGNSWTHLNKTAPVSWLSLAKHYNKAKIFRVVVATTSSTVPKHSCHEKFFILYSGLY